MNTKRRDVKPTEQVALVGISRKCGMALRAWIRIQYMPRSSRPSPAIG